MVRKEGVRGARIGVCVVLLAEHAAVVSVVVVVFRGVPQMLLGPPGVAVTVTVTVAPFSSFSCPRPCRRGCHECRRQTGRQAGR